MPSVNTTYAFNTDTAPVSVLDDDDDGRQGTSHNNVSNQNESDNDRDGLFNSNNNSTNTSKHDNSYPNQPPNNRLQSRTLRWWKNSSITTRILIIVIIILICINISLIHRNKSNRHASIAANSSSSQQQQQQTISTMLNNARIPLWKPLPPSDTVIRNIAFGSCASQNMPQSFWDTIMLPSNVASQLRPDLFIYTGDNVYGDCSSDECTELKMAYYNLSLHPTIQGIATQIPIIATLDDHDYGMNNCHAHNPYKETAKRMFREFFNYTWDDLPYHDGVYQSYTFGSGRQKVQIILLDTRYGRSPFLETKNNSSPFQPKQMDDIDQQMLSEFQWKWLKDQISNQPDVILRVIISSIQVLNDVTGFEAWRQLPMEQQRLYQLLQKEPVIFVSGDRHVGGVYEMAKTTTSSTANNKFVEITASSLTHSIPFGAYDDCSNSAECDEAIGFTRVSGPLVRENHYGTISIDYDASLVTIALRGAESSVGSTYHHPYDSIPLLGDAGEVLFNKTYAFSEL